MKKLREYIEKWIEGKSVIGVEVSLCDIHTCIYIYNEMINGNKPSFISEKVKEVLDKCGIKTKVEGIGWRIL